MANLHNVLGCCLVVCMVAHATVARTTNLFWSDPNGGISGGLYSKEHGTVVRLPDRGYPRSLLSSQVESFSYDQHSHQVLIQAKNPNRLLYGPLCQSTTRAPQQLIEIPPLFPIVHPMYGDCVECMAGGFTMYNSKIYFLFTADYFSPNGAVHRLVQVRQMESCDKHPGVKPVDESQYKLMPAKCSKVIKTIHQEELGYGGAVEVNYRTLTGMKIVEHHNKLEFFFMLRNWTSGENERQINYMTLYHVTEDMVNILYSERVTNRYGWDVSGFGSVDVKNNVICWTMTDRLMCGDFQRRTHSFSSVHKLLVPGDAAIYACTGEFPDDRLYMASIVTGVNIITASDNMHVLYGCYAQQPGMGGTGLIKYNKVNQQARKTSITFEGASVASGTLFSKTDITDEDGGCDFDPKPELCVFVPPTKAPIPESENELEVEIPPKTEGQEPEPETEVEPEEEPNNGNKDKVEPEAESTEPKSSTGSNPASVVGGSIILMFVSIFLSMLQ